MSSSPQVSNNGPRSSLGGQPSGNPFLLDKTKLNIRRSTPDSEALASSDDDQDSRHNNPPSSRLVDSGQVASKPLKPTRRPSWLNEVHTVPQRKSSFTNAPAQPASNGNDAAGWNATTSTGAGRTAAGGTTFNWGTGIWNSDTRKEPPSRLSEVLPSPTSIVPPAPYGDQEVTSPNARDTHPESNIPFAIPLHPTPKSYRSQSYSVGQVDHESAHISQAANTTSTYFNAARTRTNQGGLQHRPSRPSMLSEVSTDGSSLGRVAEIEDDDDLSTNGSVRSGGVKIPSARIESKLIEDLQTENARLRAEMEAQHTIRSVPLPSGSFANDQSYQSRETRRVRSNVAEKGSDYAIDEADDVHELQGFSRMQIADRRFSEFPVDRENRFGSLGSPINSQIESVKRGQWQSSHAFGGSEDMSIGRRRSFAESSGRHPSGSSSGSNPATVAEPSVATPYSDASVSRHSDEPISYFKGHHHVNRGYDPSYQSLTAAQIPPLHQPWKQLFHLVTFKCERAEIYYISEGMGLEIKKGSMVMVEADRGQDLGTVAEANIPFEQAKYWKDVYAKKHYEFMTMFLQNFSTDHSSGSEAMAVSGQGASRPAALGSSQNGQIVGHQEQKPSELKPKMIKRLAHDHEIAALREKEGNEAKAKRVCQQRVTDLHYNMEILDAEFQFDWRKLTFYFYAEVYVNFNILVTELFKVYKTRIWLEAVNPASLPGPNSQAHGGGGHSIPALMDGARFGDAGNLPTGTINRFGPIQLEHDAHSNGSSHVGASVGNSSSVPSFGQQLQRADFGGSQFQTSSLGPLTSSPPSFVPGGRPAPMNPAIFSSTPYMPHPYQNQPSQMSPSNMFGQNGQSNANTRAQGRDYEFSRQDRTSRLENSIAVSQGSSSPLNPVFQGVPDVAQQIPRSPYDQGSYQGQTGTPQYAASFAPTAGRRANPVNQNGQTKTQNNFHSPGSRFEADGYSDDYQSLPLGSH